MLNLYSLFEPSSLVPTPFTGNKTTIGSWTTEEENCFNCCILIDSKNCTLRGANVLKKKLHLVFLMVSSVFDFICHLFQCKVTQKTIFIKSWFNLEKKVFKCCNIFCVLILLVKISKQIILNCFNNLAVKSIVP